jgi:parallel beta-helix repeat protein
MSHSTRNNITANNISPDNLDGMYISYSSHDNLIMGNNISDNGRHGIRIRESLRNIIKQNTMISNGQNGLYLEFYSDDNIIISNEIINNDRHGVELRQSSNGNQFTQNNVISNHLNGYYISSSNKNNITGNNVSLNWNYGIYIHYSPENNIVNNFIENSSQGISLYFSSKNVIKSNNLSGSNTGIRLYESDGNMLIINKLSNHTLGIELDISIGNNLDNNTLSFNDEGIMLMDKSENNSVTNNIADQNLNSGIWISSSNNNTLTGNTINNSPYGINLFSSQKNILKENTMKGCGVFIQGPYLEHWNSHTLDNSNTVGGKPVQYLKNTGGGTIPFGAGQIILANCSNVKVEYQELRSATVGIELGFSQGNNISENNISQNNMRGIFLYSSNLNEISQNMVFANGEYGIRLENSSGNVIYHNNIMNNLAQAYDDRNDNDWDFGYPDGGNYWSDYTGVDLNSTPNQDVPPPDGIGDTPYVIDFNSRDDYPLMLLVDLPEFDFSPPVITSVLVTDITPISATVTWWTDEPADSRLNFSENPDLSINTSIYQSTQTSFHSITLTSLSPNQTYYFEILSGDEHGNYAKDDNATQYYQFTTLPPDLTPPVISHVTVNDITENSATIRWVTDEGSDSRVNWSVNSDLSNNSTKFSSIYSSSHSITLTNLLPNQIYYFEVTSVDMFGNGATDNNGSLFYTFITLEKDTDPPVITNITVVPPIQEVHNAIKITASVSDDRKIGGVWVNITGSNGKTLGNITMSYDLMNDNYYLELVPDMVGTYSFVVWAVDASNNHDSSSPIQFQVRDTTIPVITHSVFPQSQELKGNVNITSTVIDNYKVAEVWVTINLPDKSELENVSMFNGISTDQFWYIRSYDILGDYTYIIWAVDSNGNWATSGGDFTIHDSTLPSANAGLDLEIENGKTVIFNGSASTDNHRIEKYSWSFEYNGDLITLYGEMTSYLFNISGNYSVTLKVTDPSGNSATDTMWVHVLPEDIEEEDPPGEDIEPEKKTFIDSFWWLIVLFIVIFLIFLLILISRRKGKTADEIDHEEDMTKSLTLKEEQKQLHNTSISSKDTQDPSPPPPPKDESIPPPPPNNSK